MKFYCEKCNTKYGIADEKVRGKVLKVRCKRCENVITVREHQAPASKSAGKSRPNAPAPVPPSPTPANFDPRKVEWHYSVNGQSFGPFNYDDLTQRFGSGELGSECYVWTDSFSNWKPVRQVSAFKEALDRSQKVRPRPKTLGVSQALEAVRPEKFADKPDEAQASSPEPQPDQRREDRPATAEASPKQPKKSKERKPLADGQKDRLAKLRDRLKSRSKKPRPSSKPQPLSDDKPASGSAEPGPASEKPSPQDVLADGGVEQSDEELDATADTTLDDETADTRDGALAPTLPMDDPADDDAGASSGLFDDVDDPAGDDDDHGGLFDGEEAQRPDDADSGDDDDAIPFFPDAPELASDAAPDKSSSEASGITGSLLIQLDNIQKQGRGKKIVLIAAAVLLVGGLTALAIYVASQVDDDPAVAEEQPEADDSDEKVVIRTYSDDEQNKILMLADQRVDDEAAAADSEADEEAKTEADGDQPTEVAQKSGQGAPDRRVRGAEPDKDDGPSLEDALNSASAKKSNDDDFGRDLDDRVVSKTEMDSPLVDESNSFASASALSSSKRDEPIYKPTESLKERKKSSDGAVTLTRDQINAGIATVRRSVGICRERHSRRGGSLNARKIYLTVTVEPTGRVSAFDLEPKRLQNSEFQRCMTSHRGRWKFPSFDGSPQQMRAPFVLQ